MRQDHLHVSSGAFFGLPQAGAFFMPAISSICGQLLAAVAIPTCAAAQRPAARLRVAVGWSRAVV